MLAVAIPGIIAFSMFGAMFGVLIAPLIVNHGASLDAADIALLLVPLPTLAAFASAAVGAACLAELYKAFAMPPAAENAAAPETPPSPPPA